MKAWTQVPAGDINAANQRLWVAIGDNAEEKAAQREDEAPMANTIPFSSADEERAVRRAAE